MIQWKIMLKTVVIGSVVFSCWKSTSLFWIHILNWVLSSKLAEHRFYTRFAAFVANARLRTYKGLGKTNMAPIQRLLHLFYAGSTCPIFLLKMTQYAVGFSLLFKLYDRKSQDAKNPSILQGFFVTVTTQLNVCSACVVSKKKNETECFWGFLGNAHISPESLVRISWNLAGKYFRKQVSGLFQKFRNLTEQIVNNSVFLQQRIVTQ